MHGHVFGTERRNFPMDLSRVRIEKLMCELDARCKMRSQKELEEKSYTIWSMLKMYNVG